MRSQNKMIWRKHPFKLLLYVEWVLLGIALLAAATFLLPHPRQNWGSNFLLLNLVGIILIASLGWLGLRLPSNSRILKLTYVTASFGLSWLVICLVGRGERLFPALLLIVVIRGCLLFDWGGRIAVATVAYASFLAMQLMSWLRIAPLGVPLGRPISRMLRRLPPEEARRLVIGLAFNSALLFALVLAFVLLLVGAILAEHKSQAKLKVANQKLRQYAMQVEDRAILEERNRIAREIHDSVGHYLTAQSIQLENTDLLLRSQPDKASYHLRTARKLGKEALASIRTSVATLRNAKMRSLSQSLEELINQFRAGNNNLQVNATIDPTAKLPLNIATALYRVTQEALTNITKHAQATKIELTLRNDSQAILLIIRDDGCGFDPTQNTTGFGLQGMQERTLALQGDFQISSEPGQGCEIRVTIPVQVIRNEKEGKGMRSEELQLAISDEQSTINNEPVTN